MESRRVLVIRADDEFSARLRDGGKEVINFPLIRTEPLEELPEFLDGPDSISSYDALIFTSPAAADVYKGRWGNDKANFYGRIYCLGSRAREVLVSAGWEVVYVEGANTIREMIMGLGEAEFAGKKVLFFRGTRTAGSVSELLNGVCQLDEAVVYRTAELSPLAEEVDQIKNSLINGSVEWTCFFSPSGVDRFLELFPKSSLEMTRVAAIGTTTAGALDKAGLKADLISGSANARDFADRILEEIISE